MQFREFVNDKVCIIMRGCPGSGKSYKVKELISKFGGDDNHVFSADKYFYKIASEDFESKHNRKPNNEELRQSYVKVWSPQLLSAAHRFCFDKFRYAVDMGISPVIVDNTNTTTSQFERYVEYAELNDYRIRIEEPSSPWWMDACADLGRSKVKDSAKLKKLQDELLKHGQHEVPAATIEKMIDAWQNIPAKTGNYITYDSIFKKS